MKMKRKRIFCIAIMVVMLFSSMGIGAYAAIDQGAGPQGSEQAEEVQADQNGDAGADQTAPADVDVQTARDTIEAVTYKPVSLAGKGFVQGHQRIKVKWTKYTPAAEQTGVQFEGSDANYTVNESLEGYIIVRSDGRQYSAAATATSYEDRAVGDGLIDFYGRIHKGGSYSYRVAAKVKITAVEEPEATPVEPTTEPVTDPETDPAVTADNAPVIPADDLATAISKASSTAATTCVRTSAVKLKLKTKKRLTSHDRQKVSRTFAKGTTLYTCSFGIGKHMFIYGDNMYYLNRISTKSTSSITTRTPYDKETAEYFVNTRGNGSSTGKLVWVSVYTQHIYIFTGSDRNWHLQYCWAVSTGKSKTPTIRTIDPQGNAASGKMIGTSKTISKKLKKRHGIPY